MSLSLFLRNRFTNLPLPVGQALATIPFSWRPGIGRTYRLRRQELDAFERLPEQQKQAWIFSRVRNIVDYAVAHVPFYRDYYAEQGFHVERLQSYADIQRIPTISKRILQNYDLEYRSHHIAGRQLVNTGGSSGQSLALFIMANQMGNEWAHMHRIWEKLGYVPSRLKLTFGGRSDLGQGLRYDAVRHSYLVDIYAEWETVLAQIKHLIQRRRVFYLHGYPSALYEFALACKRHDAELQDMLAAQLQGAFMGSEFPMPLYRQGIEETFRIPSISWYGHTERCILAYEKREPYLYAPFQTYGYAEPLQLSDQEIRLVGTSYYNTASPLIRYDTEDQITGMEMEAGLLKAFRVDHGRSGQFVVDRHGKNIPLTALIFGRHHALFNACSHIQVLQLQPGKAVILFVPNSPQLQVEEAPQLFDSSNVALDFEFRRIEEPVRTPSGKVNLLVKEADLQRQQRSLQDSGLAGQANTGPGDSVDREAAS